MGFSRQEHWSGLPFPSPGNLPDPGIKPVFPLFCELNLLLFGYNYKLYEASLVAQMVKNLPANAGDAGLIPGLGRSPGEGNGNPLQCSCLESTMDRRALWAKVHGVPKSRTCLID